MSLKKEKKTKKEQSDPRVSPFGGGIVIKNKQNKNSKKDK